VGGFAHAAFCYQCKRSRLTHAGRRIKFRLRVARQSPGRRPERLRNMGHDLSSGREVSPCVVIGLSLRSCGRAKRLPAGSTSVPLGVSLTPTFSFFGSVVCYTQVTAEGIFCRFIVLAVGNRWSVVGSRFPGHRTMESSILDAESAIFNSDNRQPATGNP